MKGVLVIVILTLIAGTVANFARSGNDEKFLVWSTDIYPDPWESRQEIKARRESKAATPETPQTPEVPGAPDAPPTEAPGDATSPPSTPEIPTPPPGGGEQDEGPFPRLSFEEALEEWEAESTFIDARRSQEYRKGHITGAWSMSAYEVASLADKVIELLDTVPQEAPVIVYCSASADCEDSAIIGKQLQDAGFVDIRIYKGGFPEWEAKLKGDRDALITLGDERGEAER